MFKGRNSDDKPFFISWMKMIIKKPNHLIIDYLILVFGLLFLLMILACFPALPSWGDQLSNIKMPAGFSIEVFTDQVPGARSMSLSPNGTLFVGTRNQGKVYAVLDRDHDHVVDEVLVIAEGLHMPNGVAFHQNALYVAEVSRIRRYDHIEDRLKNVPDPVVVNDGFPGDEHHGWKYIAFGPDGYLYVPVGAPCNVCDPENLIFASITRINPDNGEMDIFARGIRNTVGFDWHPLTGTLWFTDNGRDWMGDDRPPDELNQASEKELHFGFPYCHGGDILDPDYGDGKSCDDFTPPVRKLGPHVAALGMTFYKGKMFPEEYQNQIFIAEHGSWNRSIPIGYRITMVRFMGGQAPRYEVFAEGWLQGVTAWGRPVDIIVAHDGALFVSDDRAGAIYRISYTKKGEIK